MPFPEGPGPCRCPASSSYTVYTKLCMYKIEKSAKEIRAEKKRTGDKLFWNWHLHTKFSYKVVTTEATPWACWMELFHAGICVIGTVVNPYCTITDSPWGCMKLACWQSSLAENLGQGGRVSSYKQYRPQCEAEQTVQNLTTRTCLWLMGLNTDK